MKEINLNIQLDACFYDDFHREILEYQHFISKEMKKCRLDKNLSFEEIAFATKIDTEILVSLENGSFSDFNRLEFYLTILAKFFEPEQNLYFSLYRSTK